MTALDARTGLQTVGPALASHLAPDTQPEGISRKHDEETVLTDKHPEPSG